MDADNGKVVKIMAKKIWLDTMVANEYGARLIPHLEDFFEKGFTVVSAETTFGSSSTLFRITSSSRLSILTLTVSPPKHSPGVL